MSLELEPGPAPALIRVLMIDDDPVQVHSIKRQLGLERGFELASAGNLGAGLARLAQGGVDVLLLDLNLPDSNGAATVFTAQTGFPHMPIVVMTSTDDDELGESLIKAGAQDFIVKGQITSELLRRSLRYAIDRKRLVSELQDALASIKHLKGLIPICASCKRVRTEAGAWEGIEQYIMKHSEADFTHGLCKDCGHKLYPKYYPEPGTA